MIGTQILSYRIERLIGEGGMGSVYLAVHTHIGRKVAIKALNPNLARNHEIRERFKNEASMLSQLHHPSIVALYDYVELDSGVFLVMEYAEGQPLDEYIEKVTGPIPEERAIPLFNQILDGVAYAHQKNVVHRDIKPSNIIIGPDGKAKILDFGIAKIIGDTSNKLTKTGTKLGTVLYMSPEQVKGQEMDYRTDIYSLGITLFEMLTGRCPYNAGSTEYEVYKKIVEEPLPDARQYYPGISERMVAIINKATQKELKDRFQSCEEFKQYVLGEKNLDATYTQRSAPIIKEKTQQNIPAKRKRSSRRGYLLFWNLFMACFLTFAVIIAGIRLINLHEQKYVLAWKLYLRNSKSANEKSNTVRICDFGDKLDIINSDETSDDAGLRWAKVRAKGGDEGYVALNYLGSEKEYRQIKAIFTEGSQKETFVAYKKAVRNYLLSKDYIDSDGSPTWRVYSDPAGSDFNAYTYGDFNNDGVMDYACIIENIKEKHFRLLAFIGKNADEANLALEEEFYNDVSLHTMKKGEKIYTGKYRTEYQYDIWGIAHPVVKKEYEALMFDGLVLKNKENGKHFLYIFNARENRFIQAVELK